MRGDFETAGLKAALERSLGFGLKSLIRLDGAKAFNFRAERESDGFLFAVKCSPKSRQVMFDHLVAHLREMEGTKAVKRLFAAECPPVFRGFNVICLSWCAGERKFPDELTEPQLIALLDDYREFSAAMQKATGIAPHDPMLAWHEAALANCRGIAGRGLRKLIERELPAEGVTYRKELLKTVHGDFHHGNFLFVEGTVSGFLDLEEFCEGYPADDLVRYFVCAAEHLKGFGVFRLGRILERFAAAVRHLPYSREEWEVAINCLLLKKVYMKVKDGSVGFARAANLLFRARLYRRMKRIVRKLEKELQEKGLVAGVALPCAGAAHAGARRNA